ncbi:YggS family pyridoxal phosphate-dependent enzyme [Granulicella sp. L46]|uniref:YggS family pyridoxal phosphate-dependent enzyme n=1 Tax=Granulicella sp. L46 TaxID=1641865 RepID=UPI00131E54CF|nr:YggS family pyridoxal phosphate-dependent enzyme [Granulicella sp. L46]
MSIASNLERVQNQIAEACARAHRDPSTVALMAVSKMHPAEAVREAYEAGQRLFGENRVQEWQTKRAELSDLFALPPSGSSQSTRSPSPAAQAHLIGPLQNNKTAKAAEIFDAIDTLGSLKTAERLNAAAQSLSKTLRILIEVKLSPEDTKHGLAPEDLPALLRALQPLTHLQPRGLMTVPPFDENPETARPYFQHLRHLRDEHLTLYPTLTDLSMGMSNDFAVAIEEGSTTVRIGTAIFGKRTYA